VTAKYAPESPADITFYARWVKLPSQIVVGFADGSSLLTAKMKTVLDRFLSANSGLKSVTCIGQTEGPTVLRSDSVLARKRGQAACGYLQRRYPNLRILTVTGKNLLLEADRHRSVLVRLNK
jgi:hypothetical protein